MVIRIPKRTYKPISSDEIFIDWLCEDCDIPESNTVQSLIDGGTPICEGCDSEMNMVECQIETNKGLHT